MRCRLVRWGVVVDPDGDPIQYRGDFSDDDGASWSTLFPLQSGTSYSWDTSALPAGLDYRVRIFANDGIDDSAPAVSGRFQLRSRPNTVHYRLRIRNQEDDDDEVIFSSHPCDDLVSLAGPPQGDGQEFSHLSGETNIGSYRGQVIDRLRVDDTWTVSEKVFDAEARQQLLSRRAYWEISRDEGDNWAVLVAGYVNDFTLTGALPWDFTVGEARRTERVRKVFEKATDTFPTVSALIGGPIKGGWGPIADNGGWFFDVIAKDAETVTLQFRQGFVPDPNGGRVLSEYQNADHLAAINQAALADLERSGAAGTSGRFPGIDVRVVGINGVVTDDSYVPRATLASPSDTTPRLITGRMVLEWATAQPNVDDIIELYAWRKTIDASNPLHIGGHPLDIQAALWDEAGFAYDGTALTALRTDLGDDLAFLLYITQSYDIESFTQLLGSVAGYAVRFNDLGERVVFRTRVRPTDAPAQVVTIDDLREVEVETFKVEESTLRNAVTLNQLRFFPWSPNQGTQRPFDDVFPEPISATIKDGETQFLGENTQVYNLPGIVLATVTGDGYGDDAFAEALARETFDRFGRGGAFTTIMVTPTIDAAIGECLTLNLPHLPIAGSRGGIRIAQIVKRTPVPGGFDLRVLDNGQDAQPATNPTFTLAAGATDPRKFVDVTITNAATLNANDIRVRVEWGFGAVQPDGGAVVREFAAGDVPGSFTLPAVDAGTDVWVRMQSLQPGKLAGDYTAWDDVDLDDLEPPTGLDFLSDTDNDGLLNVQLTGVVETDMPHEILLRLQGAPSGDAVVVATLAPGATSTVLQLALDTDYTIGVRAAEALPFRARSATYEEDTSIGTAFTLDAPTNLSCVLWYPRTLYGMLCAEYELWAIGPRGSPYLMQFQVARETGFGTGIYGAWSNPEALLAGGAQPAVASNGPGTWTKTRPATPTFATPDGNILLVQFDDIANAKFRCRLVGSPTGGIDADGFPEYSVNGDWSDVLIVDPSVAVGEPPLPGSMGGSGIDLSTLDTPGVLYAAPSAFGTVRNISATRKFVAQSGNGVDASSPVLVQPAFTDITGNLAFAQLPTSGAGGTWSVGGALAITGGTVTVGAFVATTGAFSGDITTTSDDIVVGFGVTTAAQDGRLKVNAGTNSGANNRDAIVEWQRGGVAEWRAGVIGSVAANLNWTLRDVVNGANALVITQGATPAITTGLWNATKIGLTYGGTNADLSATGGTSQVLRQSSTGAAITVGQLAFSDITSTLAYAQLPTGGGTWANGGTLSITGGVTTVAGLTSSAVITASLGEIITAGQSLRWSTDNAAGSTIGASGASRPYGGYFGTEVVAGADPGGASAVRVGGSITAGASTSSSRFVGKWLPAVTAAQILTRLVSQAGSDGINYADVGTLGFEAIGNWQTSGDTQTWAFIQAIPAGSTTLTTIAHFAYQKWDAASDNQCDLGEITTPRRYKTGYFGTSVVVRHDTNQATGLLLIGRLTGTNTPRLQWENLVDWPGAGVGMHQAASNLLTFNTGVTAGGSSGTQRWQYDTTGVRPTNDDAMLLGGASNRWSTIYGYTGDFTTQVKSPIHDSGSATDLLLKRNATTVLTLSATEVVSALPIRTKGYTVATLPAGTTGDIAHVTDALAPAFLTAVVGGGAAKSMVFYDGTAWVAA